MSEKIRSEMISRRGAFIASGLGGSVEPGGSRDGDDRNGCRGPRW